MSKFVMPLISYLKLHCAQVTLCCCLLFGVELPFAYRNSRFRLVASSVPTLEVR